MGRRTRSTKSRSFFSALPPQLKHELRSQSQSYSQPSLEEPPAGLASTASSGTPTTRAEDAIEARPDPRHLLPTQPSSECDDDDDAHIEIDTASAAGPSRSSFSPDDPSIVPTQPSASIVLSRKRASPTELGSASTKRQKGKGRAAETDNQYEGHDWDCTGLVPRYTDAAQVPKHLKKYFFQRHSLWPAYSRLPLLMDDTGWFSVTPATIAAHIADRCRCDVVLDAFCGVGGNAIAFAKTCERVIAMDNDMTRLRLARHNALHHGVADRIEFVLADYVQWAKDPKGAIAREAIDVVFLSPPWGGPEYLSVGDRHDGEHPSYPLSAILPIPGDELFELTVPISPNIAYFLPRNVNVDELSALALRLDTPANDTSDGSKRTREWVEIEEDWVGDKLKAVTAYYGGLVENV